MRRRKSPAGLQASSRRPLMYLRLIFAASRFSGWPVRTPASLDQQVSPPGPLQAGGGRPARPDAGAPRSSCRSRTTWATTTSSPGGCGLRLISCSVAGQPLSRATSQRKQNSGSARFRDQPAAPPDVPSAYARAAPPKSNGPRARARWSVAAQKGFLHEPLLQRLYPSHRRICLSRRPAAPRRHFPPPLRPRHLDSYRRPRRRTLLPAAHRARARSCAPPSPPAHPLSRHDAPSPRPLNRPRPPASRPSFRPCKNSTTRPTS